MITANAAAQRWVDDALAFPRAIPASVRTALDGGIVAHGGGLYLASAYRELDLSPAALDLKRLLKTKETGLCPF